MKTQKNNSKSKLSKLVIFALAAVLAFSTLLVVGCKKDETEDPVTSPSVSPSPSYVDQSVGNGYFDLLYDTSDNTDYPRDPKSWSYTIDGKSPNKAPSSSSDLLKGVISLDETKYDAIKESKLGDLVNPGVAPYTEDYKEADDKQKNVLMLYNKKNTAISYKSPSISLAANSYVKLTAWIKTANLVDSEEEALAYLRISGGIEENVYLRNISANDGWKQVTFYFESSTYSSKSINLEFGLGYGDNNHASTHQKGYAFLDNVELTYLSQHEFYEDKRGEVDESAAFYADGDEMGTATSSGYQTEQVANAEDLSALNVSYSYVKNSKIRDDDLKQLRKMTEFNSANYDQDSRQTTGSDTQTGAEAKFGVTADNVESMIHASTPEDNKKAIIDEVKNAPFSAGTSFMLLNNYEKTRLQVTQNNITSISPYKYYRISFWVKTSEYKDAADKLSVVLTNGKTGKDYAEKGTFTAINTTTNEVDLDKEENTKTYKWRNWQQYTFLVKSSIFEGESDLALNFYLGPQKLADETSNETYFYKLVQGYALISQPQLEELTSTEFASASTGDQVKKVELTSSSTTTVANGSFDTPQNNFGDYDFSKGPLAPASWKMYAHGQSAVGGNDKDIAPTTSITGFSSGIVESGQKGNPRVLRITSATNPTAVGYAMSSYLSLSTNSYYRLRVTAKADAGTKFGIYLVDSDRKVQDGPKDKNKDDLMDLSFVGTGTGKTETYEFWIHTGYEAKSVRFELWFGERNFDNSTKETLEAAYTKGWVEFDDASMITSTEKAFNAITADNKTIIKTNYIEVDPEPSPSPSTSPSPSPSEDTDETEHKIGWLEITVGIASFLIVIALIIVAIRKFVDHAKKKTKKAKAHKEIKNPERMNVYTGKKKHYGKRADESKENDENDEQSEESEETESDETEEATEEEAELEEDDLEDEAEDILDDEESDDDKKE